jgi:hypothetical protein
MGRHSRPGGAPWDRAFRSVAVRRAGVVAVMAAGVLAGCGSWQSATAATPAYSCGDQEEPDDEDAPPPSHGENHGLLIIDNSNADSWLEVDRTLNTLFDSEGTAGSDHDGDGGDVTVTPEPSAPSAAPRTAAQPADTATTPARSADGDTLPAQPAGSDHDGGSAAAAQEPSAPAAAPARSTPSEGDD